MSIDKIVTTNMFKLMELAKAKGQVDSQRDWLIRIGSNPGGVTQLKSGAYGFQLAHIQKAVELVGVDYNFVFGYKGGNDATIERIRTVLTSLLEVLPEPKKGQKRIKTMAKT